MSPATRRSLQVEARRRIPCSLNSIPQVNPTDAGALPGESNGARKGPKPRVYAAAGNRLLREALSRMLKKNGDIEVIGGGAVEAVQQEERSPGEAEILLLSSSGTGARPGGDSESTICNSRGLDSFDRRDWGRDEFPATYPCGSPGLPSAGRFRGGCCRCGQSAPCGPGLLLRSTLRGVVSLSGARGYFLCLRHRTPKNWG
jgi:hypothetical protein